ncbi:MAG: ATPase [Bacteroidales bacterium]|nr:ATPase [Bacteroidales bacterium]
MIQLIADSGATKTEWRVLCDGSVKEVATIGISPVYLKPVKIKQILKKEVLPVAGGDVEQIWFYGAGVVGDLKDALVECFAEVFPKAQVSVESDMLAACRALFGDNPGIACILGTGSNCCFWDGKEMTSVAKAGGFILGDEGSGANMGKRFISDYIKGLVPDALVREFDRRYHLSYADIVSKVYREEAPSRFLASFSTFIGEHQNHPYMKNLIVESLQDFVDRNVMHYDPRRNPVGFVGSVAEAYQPFIHQIFRTSGFKLGPLCAKPIEGLVRYHSGK